MWIERLDASHALDYRALMLEAYDLHPQAFTSSVRERATMPLSWWESRLTSKLDVVFGAFEDGALSGIVGLAFEPGKRPGTRRRYLACMCPAKSGSAGWVSNWCKPRWMKRRTIKACG